MSTYFEKITLTVKGGGVNPYGQPDRKKTFFFDDRPKDCVKIEIHRFIGLGGIWFGHKL